MKKTIAWLQALPSLLSSPVPLFSLPFFLGFFLPPPFPLTLSLCACYAGYVQPQTMNLNKKSRKCNQISIAAMTGPINRGDNTNEKSTQTVYCKYVLVAQIESVVTRNQMIHDQALDVNLGDKRACVYINIMSPSVILADSKKCKYFIGLYPKQFRALFDFLGEAKYDLTYWNSSHAKSKISVTPSLQSQRSQLQKLPLESKLFITLWRLRRGFKIYTIHRIHKAWSEHGVEALWTGHFQKL